MTSILSTKPWLRDPQVTCIPWRQEIVDSTLARASLDGAAMGKLPLKFGIYWTDNVVEPQPPIARGLRMVHEAVREAGHKMVNWNPPPQSIAKGVHVGYCLHSFTPMLMLT